MPRAVEHNSRDVVGPASERICDRLHVLTHRLEQIDRTARAWADSQLAHVHVGQLEEGAALADRDHRHRTVAATCDDAAPLERIEGEIDGLAACTDVLAGAKRGV